MKVEVLRIDAATKNKIKSNRYGRKLKEALALYAILGGRILRGESDGLEILKERIAEEKKPQEGHGRPSIDPENKDKEIKIETILLPELEELMEWGSAVGGRHEAIRVFARVGLESGKDFSSVIDVLIESMKEKVLASLG